MTRPPSARSLPILYGFLAVSLFTLIFGILAMLRPTETRTAPDASTNLPAGSSISNGTSAVQILNP